MWARSSAFARRASSGVAAAMGKGLGVVVSDLSNPFYAGLAAYLVSGAWLAGVLGLVLGALNVAEQYAPLALGLTTRRLSLPGGELASWVASWAFVPGIVIGVVFLVLLFPDGRLPSRRWWPLGLAGAVALAVPTVVLAVGTWPLRGPELVTPEGEEPDLVTAVFGITLMTTLALGAISVVALVLRFRRAGAVQRQQIKWFAYLAAPSVPLGMFAQNIFSYSFGAHGALVGSAGVAVGGVIDLMTSSKSVPAA